MSEPQVHYVITKSANANKVTSDLKRHTDFGLAKIEAERLAYQEKKEFYIYRLVGVARPAEQPIEFINLTTKEPL